MMIRDTVGDGVVAAAGVMTTENDAEAVAPAVAVTVTANVPAVVGVPVTAPVAELIVSPAGSPLAAQVTVPVPPASPRGRVVEVAARTQCAVDEDGPRVVVGHSHIWCGFRRRAGRGVYGRGARPLSPGAGIPSARCRRSPSP